MNSQPITSAWTLRPLLPTDVPDLLQVQAACYGPEYLESAEVYARRLACPHHCSWAVVAAGRPGLVGYLAAYWSDPGRITALHADFAAPESGELLYLHDMAVLPSLAGQGIASRLWQAARRQALARGVVRAALVSVQDSQAYWERQGFQTQLLDAESHQRLVHSYGSEAAYMTAFLTDI